MAAHGLAQLQERLQAGELGVGGVGVGADVEDALGGLPAEELGGALDHVLARDPPFPLGPDLDPLEERPGPVPSRLPRRERRVQVHVRLDERRREEPPRGVYLARRRPVDAGRHALNVSSGDGHVNEAAVEPGSAQDQVKHNPVSPHTAE